MVSMYTLVVNHLLPGRRKGGYYECVGDSYLCYCCGDYRGYRSLDSVETLGGEL